MKKLLRKWLPERTRAKWKSALYIPPLMMRELLLPFSKKADKGEALYFEARRLIHRIEKNLIITKRREYSGYSVVEDVIRLFRIDKELNYLDHGTRAWAVMALERFYGIVRGESAENDGLARQAVTVLEKIENFLKEQKNMLKENPAPLKIISEQPAFSLESLEHLSRNRVSVRNFQPREVSDEAVFNAMEVARQYPSACNRQGAGLTMVKSRKLKKSILKMQAGMSGFSHEIPLLSIVHFSKAAYPAYHERHTGYLECGLFAMGYIWGLQAQGVYSVPLNWAYRTLKNDRKLHQLAGLKDSLEVACLLASGYPEFPVTVPSSPKREVAQLYSEV